MERDATAARDGSGTEEVPELRGTRMLLRRVRSGDELDRLASGRDVEAVRMYGGDTRDMRAFTAEDADAWLAFQQRQRFG